MPRWIFSTTKEHNNNQADSILHSIITGFLDLILAVFVSRIDVYITNKVHDEDNPHTSVQDIIFLMCRNLYPEINEDRNLTQKYTLVACTIIWIPIDFTSNQNYLIHKLH